MALPRPVVLAFALLALLAPCARAASDAGASGAASIEYRTVAAALAGLRARKDVHVSVRDGWTLATERSGLVLWSFTPKDYPAYPAVVKRTLSQQDGGWHLGMDVLCEAKKEACDTLVQDFQTLNERMKKAIAHMHEQRGNAPGGAPAAAPR